MVSFEDLTDTFAAEGVAAGSDHSRRDGIQADIAFLNFRSGIDRLVRSAVRLNVLQEDLPLSQPQSS